MYYLKKRNKAEYTGVHSFVTECQENEDLKWIPNRTSFVIQNVKGTATEEKEDGESIVEVLGTMSKSITSLGKEVSSLKDRMTALESTTTGA